MSDNNALTEGMFRTEDKLMADLKAGISVFKFVPTNIGEILYCDSNNPKAEPDAKERISIKVILSIVIPIAIVAFCWLVFDESPIWNTVVTIVMAIISIYLTKGFLFFRGVDFFVGSEGMAVVSFDKTRDNITYKFEVFFRDFKDLLTSETKQYSNGIYQHTDYSFIVYGREVGGKKKIIARREGFYFQEDPNDYYTDTIYRFWKKIEYYWSQYKLTQLKESLN